MNDLFDFDDTHELLVEDTVLPEDPTDLPHVPPSTTGLRFRRFPHKHEYEPVSKELERIPFFPRPTWMQNPTLLPKRPPGK
jgi:hypothetical protein